MLTSVVGAALTAALLVFVTGEARADDGQWASMPTVSANAVCQHPTAPTCLASLTVKRGDEESQAAPLRSLQPHSTAPICHYVQGFEYVPARAVQAGGGAAQVEVEHLVCPGGSRNLGAPWAFRPVPRPASDVSIRSLVDQASKALAIPKPDVALSPAASATQYVGLPLWAWSAASKWKTLAVSVSAGGVTLTLTSSPVFTVWSMGDGGSMTCQGPGTPYPAKSRRTPRTSPDCGYTYAAPSTSRPGGSYPVSVTTHWKVAWTTTSGLSGSEPDMTTTSSFPLTVSEIQGLVTDVRP